MKSGGAQVSVREKEKEPDSALPTDPVGERATYKHITSNVICNYLQ